MSAVELAEFANTVETLSRTLRLASWVICSERWVEPERQLYVCERYIIRIEANMI